MAESPAESPHIYAIADAIPLLERSGHVEVVIVANERGKQEEIEGADMGQHLARHGLNVEVHRITKGDLDVADALLSHAADADVDFIVMAVTAIPACVSSCLAV